MSLTRREREIIEDMLRKLDQLEENIFQLDTNLTVLSNAVSILSGRKNVCDLSKDELVLCIREAVEEITKTTKIKKHTHKNDKQGGPAFAKLGATLIEGEDIENEEPTP